VSDSSTPPQQQLLHQSARQNTQPFSEPFTTGRSRGAVLNAQLFVLSDPQQPAPVVDLVARLRPSAVAESTPTDIIARPTYEASPSSSVSSAATGAVMQAIDVDRSTLHWHAKDA
jgi:hypothetical protein